MNAKEELMLVLRCYAVVFSWAAYALVTCITSLCLPTDELLDRCLANRPVLFSAGIAATVAPSLPIFCGYTAPYERFFFSEVVPLSYKLACASTIAVSLTFSCNALTSVLRYVVSRSFGLESPNETLETCCSLVVFVMLFACLSVRFPWRAHIQP